ncbi:MAG: hypothetical protein ABI266_02310, partial [Ginsengibacter sp.]
MKKQFLNLLKSSFLATGMVLCSGSLINVLYAQKNPTADSGKIASNTSIISAKKINPTTIEVLLDNDQKMIFDFYGENIFRIFQDNSGKMMREPESKPEAHILVENPRRPVSKLDMADHNNLITITTGSIKIDLDKKTSLLKVFNQKTNKIVIEETQPFEFKKERVLVTLKENNDEYFYGGGVQNGRFSHKGKSIAIENLSTWTDLGVASPTPFYWSSKGYGFMWYTFKEGNYDFGSKTKGSVSLAHNTGYL